jgi:hypothetical protein
MRFLFFQASGTLWSILLQRHYPEVEAAAQAGQIQELIPDSICFPVAQGWFGWLTQVMDGALAPVKHSVVGAATHKGPEQ